MSLVGAASAAQTPGETGSEIKKQKHAPRSHLCGALLFPKTMEKDSPPRTGGQGDILEGLGVMPVCFVPISHGGSTLCGDRPTRSELLFVTVWGTHKFT